MYAVIKTGGKQYRVKSGDVIEIERLGELEAGSTVTFEEVLSVGEGYDIKIGTPIVEGAKVEGKIVEDFRGPKLIAFKMKKRKGYRKTIGHRQDLTRVQIENIIG